MKKRNTLQALSLALLPVLAVLFAACDSGYKPQVHITPTSFSLLPGVKDLKVRVGIPTKIEDNYYVTWDYVGDDDMLKLNYVTAKDGGPHLDGSPLITGTTILTFNVEAIQGGQVVITVTVTTADEPPREVAKEDIVITVKSL